MTVQSHSNTPTENLQAWINYTHADGKGKTYASVATAMRSKVGKTINGEAFQNSTSVFNLRWVTVTEGPAAGRVVPVIAFGPGHQVGVEELRWTWEGLTVYTAPKTRAR